MERSFQQRLKSAQQGGNLTVADLARWFKRPDPTVRGWVKNGVEPGGAPLDIKQVYTALTQLEKMIAQRCGFPMLRLSPQARIQELKKLRSNY